ncbi:MAG: DNA polymerase III subunit delta [Bacteroidales bacterium]|nr:DNA polymerase III subunit delta [Bacteroidales bacterium]
MAKSDSNSYQHIINDVKRGDIKPIYLLTGDENYFIDQVSDFFEKEFIDEGARDFDQTVLYGAETDLSAILSCAKRYPFASPKQLVLVKEAQNIKKSWDDLVTYLKNPQPTTVLVICYRHKKFDKRTTLYKSIAKAGVVMESQKISDWELPRWILTYVTAKGYQITETAAMMLANNIGSELDKIANELGKLFVVLPVGSAITEDHIEQYIGISKSYNMFELQKAISQRNVVQCNKIIQHYANNPKEYPLPPLIATLYSFFVKVMILIQNPESANPYGAKDVETAAKNYQLPKLASCIQYLHETDLRSKGIRNANTVTDGELLKELLFKILH